MCPARCESRSRRNVPELEGVVEAARQHAAAVERARDRTYPTGMPRQSADLFSRRDVPELEGPVTTPRQGVAPVGRECDRNNTIRMPNEGADLPSGRDVPKFKRLVGASRIGRRARPRRTQPKSLRRFAPLATSPIKHNAERPIGQVISGADRAIVAALVSCDQGKPIVSQLIRNFLHSKPKLCYGAQSRPAVLVQRLGETKEIRRDSNGAEVRRNNCPDPAGFSVVQPKSEGANFFYSKRP